MSCLEEENREARDVIINQRLIFCALCWERLDRDIGMCSQS